jgi:hypothetical protein
MISHSIRNGEIRVVETKPDTIFVGSGVTLISGSGKVQVWCKVLPLGAELEEDGDETLLCTLSESSMSQYSLGIVVPSDTPVGVWLETEEEDGKVEVQLFGYVTSIGAREGSQEEMGGMYRNADDWSEEDEDNDGEDEGRGRMQAGEYSDSDDSEEGYDSEELFAMIAKEEGLGGDELMGDDEMVARLGEARAAEVMDGLRGGGDMDDDEDSDEENEEEVEDFMMQSSSDEGGSASDDEGEAEEEDEESESEEEGLLTRVSNAMEARSAAEDRKKQMRIVKAAEARRMQRAENDAEANKANKKDQKDDKEKPIQKREKPEKPLPEGTLDFSFFQAAIEGGGASSGASGSEKAQKKNKNGKVGANTGSGKALQAPHRVAGGPGKKDVVNKNKNKNKTKKQKQKQN